MRTLQFNTRSTCFQQIFAPFCVLIAEVCISLFVYILASKLRQLLITAYAAYTNQFQREFDSNVAIRTFEFCLASKHPRQKTNFFKPIFSSWSLCRGVLSLRAADSGKLHLCFAEMLHTNRIQREFLFNNAIHSQNPIPASSPPARKPNFLKLLLPSPTLWGRAGDGGVTTLW
jgi:hypothetical protein